MRPWLAVSLLLALGCTRPAPAGEGEATALARADEAASLYATALRGRLQEAMKQGGPKLAVEVCKADAKALGVRAGAPNGARVGRGSLRLRSRDNAPPAWVNAWLEAQGERAASGVQGVREVKGGVAPAHYAMSTARRQGEHAGDGRRPRRAREALDAQAAQRRAGVLVAGRRAVDALETPAVLDDAPMARAPHGLGRGRRTRERAGQATRRERARDARARRDDARARQDRP